jgi:hypothetical protein
MDYRWTRTGLIVDVTNRVNGMLEQGGVCGRIEHYSEDDISALGITRDDNLNECGEMIYVTRLELIRARIQPRLLRRGITIR